MKLLIAFVLVISSTAFASNQVELKAQGFKEITIGGMLNPFTGAVKGASKLAKKELIKKCNEMGGEIVGEITFETLRYDEGIMGAIVEATGTCQQK